MKRKSIILVGAPETGKSNYVGRLWGALKADRGVLKRAGMPKNIEYVESICAHLLQGEFAGRTDTNMPRQDFCIPLKTDDRNEITELVVPDFTGELWRDAVKNSEIPQEWLSALEDADGALLFVRAHSPLNIQPLDWVTTRSVLRHAAGEGNNAEDLPTQVVLCELLRLLDARLSKKADGSRPRVAVIITAWDTLDPAAKSSGPLQYLRSQFPLFCGMIEDAEDTEVKVYGMSIVGGDLSNLEFRRKFHDGMIMSESGTVAVDKDGACFESADITIPVAWAIKG